MNNILWDNPSDLHWIDLQYSQDISFWMQEFGVTESLLREAVQRAGGAPEAVADFLQVRSTPSQFQTLV